MRKTILTLLATLILAFALLRIEGIPFPGNLMLAISLMQLIVLLAILRRLDRENPTP